MIYCIHAQVKRTRLCERVSSVETNECVNIVEKHLVTKVLVVKEK